MRHIWTGLKEIGYRPNGLPVCSFWNILLITLSDFNKEYISANTNPSLAYSLKIKQIDKIIIFL